MNRQTRRNGINYIARNRYCDYDAVLTDIQLQQAYSQCVDKLGELEDLLQNADSIKIIKRNGIASLHIDMILDSETYPIAESLFGKESVLENDK